jgi:parvulin-like peptidyl-prolyl isomerase
MRRTQKVNAKKIVLSLTVVISVICVVALMRATAVPRIYPGLEGIASVNQQTITEEEFQSYVDASFQRKHFAALNVKKVGDLEGMLNAYIEEKILISQDIKRKNITERDAFISGYQIGLDKLIAQKYTAGKLTEELAVTDEDLAGIVPPGWTQLKLTQILLTNKAEATAVLAKARAGEDFVGLVREYSVGPGAHKDGDLGYKFPGSGYFERVDEAYLFLLEPGDISEVVETPLGPAICRVEDKKTYSEEEIEKFLKRPKAVIFNHKVVAHVGDIREKAGVELHLDVLRDCIKSMQEAVKKDGVIAEVGDHKIYFYDLQRTLPTPYDRIYIDPTFETLYSLYQNNLDRKVDDHLLAQEAAIFDVAVETEGEQAQLRKFAEMVAMRVLGEELFAGLSVNDQEAEEYFDSHLNEFNTPERAKLWQILLPNRMAAELMIEKINSGESFKKLAESHSIDQRSGRFGGYMGIFPREGLEPKIAEAAFSMIPGDYSEIIETEHGFHILWLEGTLSAKTNEFTEARGKARKVALREKQGEVFDKYVKGLVAEARIEINDDALRKMFSKLNTRAPSPPNSPHF